MKLIMTKTSSLVKRMSLAGLQKGYLELAEQIDDLQAGRLLRCNCCGEFYRCDEFYMNSNYKVGYFPVCKKCLLEMATDDDPKNKRRIDNRQKTIRVFSMLDIPFIDDIYQKALNEIMENNLQRGKTAYQQLISAIVSLPQFRKMHFSDSSFANADEVLMEIPDLTKKARRDIKKLFGSGYSETDYLYLQDQYDDFRARTQVDSKSQEVYVVQICLQLLEIDKDRKQGKDVTKKLAALDSFMASAKLQPKQNANNAATDSLSFGELIEKWENEKPIPEPDPEFKDVNGIGKLIRVYFAGHLSKALGLKNSYSQEYEEELKKYTVTPPQVGENGSSDTYQQLFGNED